jgi:myosin-5
MRVNPEVIKGFANLKFSQISCGFNHCIAKTSLGKVYLWGWGEHGQLGNDQFTDLLSPSHLRTDFGVVTQVFASFKSTLLLIENKHILWCGSNGTISY